MKRNEWLRGVTTFAGVTMLASCVVQAIIVGALVLAAIAEALLQFIKRLGNDGDKDIENEIRQIKDTIEEHTGEDGTVRLPEEVSGAIKEEIEKLQEKHEDLEDLIDDLIDQYEDVIIDSED